MSANCYVVPITDLGSGTWVKAGVRPVPEVEQLIGRELEVGEMVIIGRYRRHAVERLDAEHCQVFQRVHHTAAERGYLKRQSPSRPTRYGRRPLRVRGPRRRWSPEL